MANNKTKPRPNRLFKLVEWLFETIGLCGHKKWSHWMVRISDAMFVDCPCCILFRGFFMGALFGVPAGLILGVLI